MKQKFFFFLLFILPLSGTLFPAEEEAPYWTPARLELEEGGADPIGGWNRIAFAVTDYGMRYVGKPVAVAYTTILPKPVIDIIDNMCRNLMFPRKCLTCLGSAEWIGARDELGRFLINTTIGLGGMFDPARHWFHLYDTGSDAGMMFAKWGIGPGCTFLFPFLPYVNVRDMTGGILDYALDGRTYLPYTSWTYLNYVVIAEDSYAGALDGAVDRYHTFRTAMLIRRDMEIKFWKYHTANKLREQQKEREANPPPPPEDVMPPAVEGVSRPLHIPYFGSDGTWLDTLRAVRFSPQKNHHFWYMRRSYFNSDFISQAEKREVETAPDTTYEYLFWQPDPEEHPVRPEKELVLILPGLGAHKDGTAALAMAELIRGTGRWTVTVGSAFTVEFLQAAGFSALPGYAPEDAVRMKTLLEKILLHLQKDGFAFDRVSVVGWSFGGLHTLFLADLCAKDPASPLQPARFLAVNPPADLDHAIRTADGLYALTRDWTLDQVKENLREAVGYYLAAGEYTLPPYDPAGPVPADFYRIPVSEDQAKMLIALSFRTSIRDVLLASHLKHPFPNFQSSLEMPERNALLNEIDKVSFESYARDFLVPDLRKGSYPELARGAGLRAVEKTLRNDPKIRVIHTADDFLLHAEDRAWLSSVLGDRLIWFDRGGHLGNLYTKFVQDKILELLETGTADAISAGSGAKTSSSSPVNGERN